MGQEGKLKKVSSAVVKKLVPIIPVRAAMVGLAADLVVSPGTKKKDDNTSTELTIQVLSETPLDKETMALLSEVRTNWTETTIEVGGPHADALKTLGGEPSVASLTDLMT